MSSPNNPPEPNPPDEELLHDGQSIVGVVRHEQTGAFIVWMSLDAHEITPVGAWQSEAVALAASEETAEEFHRLYATIEQATPEESEEAGTQHWASFLHDMKRRSDAALTPFPDKQLVDIGEYIADLLHQRSQVPDAPDGFMRLLTYPPDALQGGAMPRVRLTPMEMPPRKHKGSRGHQP